jgi:rhamnosyltransferase
MSASGRPSVSVVIPVLNAAPWLPALLERLDAQRPAPPDEVVIVDSGSTDGTPVLAEAHPRVRLVRVGRFSHGGARNLGIARARGELVALLTQDALPADADWLARLTAPLADPQVAGVYARQVPRPGASPMEQFFLSYWFPGGASVRRTHTAPEPPVYPATLFSNVSAAARRDTWLRFPFNAALLMGEDQQFARDALQAGWAIVYEPAAVVIHSHAYSLSQTFRRYFDSVVAFRQIFAVHGPRDSAALGRAYVRRELAFLLRRHPRWLPYYAAYLAFKTAGVLAGHAAHRWPRAWCARCSLHPEWWRAR